MTEDDDVLDRLVRDAQAGDPAAFGRVWQMLSGRVFGYLRGRGVASPEDVTSEVFLAAYAGLASFSGDGARFRSWLFTIAHHKAVDDLRRRRDDDSYDADLDPRLAPSAEADALAAGLDRDVQAALEALTPEQREVLLLRTLGDLSLEEVAALTGRTTGSVKQLQHRASKAAQRALAERDERPRAPRGRHLRAVTSTAPDAIAEL